MLSRVLIGSAMLLLLVHPQANETAACRWRGSAPLCLGSCHPGETLAVTDRHGDGLACLLGQKALCCQRSQCEWRGDAPFCNAACDAGEIAVVYDREGPADTESCLTGKKALCCPMDDGQDH